MSKLISCLAVICAFLSVWLALLYQFACNKAPIRYQTVLFYLPLIILILFGLYSVSIVLFRVFNFNDCQKEAIQLQHEIIEARADLTAKGFVFK